MPSALKNLIMTEKPKNSGHFWDAYLFAISEYKRLGKEIENLHSILKGRDPDFDFSPWEDQTENPFFPSAGDALLHVLKTEGPMDVSTAEKRVAELIPAKAKQFGRSVYQLKSRGFIEEHGGKLRLKKA